MKVPPPPVPGATPDREPAGVIPRSAILFQIFTIQNGCADYSPATTLMSEISPRRGGVVPSVWPLLEVVGTNCSRDSVCRSRSQCVEFVWYLESQLTCRAGIGRHPNGRPVRKEISINPHFQESFPIAFP